MKLIIFRVVRVVWIGGEGIFKSTSGITAAEARIECERDFPLFTAFVSFAGDASGATKLRNKPKS